MNILWLVRPNLDEHRGGDTVQIHRTRQVLQERGVRITISRETRPTLRGYDLVHLWHLDRLWENLPHVRRVKAAGLPMVLSTIWWPSAEFDRFGRNGVQQLFGTRYPGLRNFHHGVMAAIRDGRPSALAGLVWNFQRAAKELIREAAALLPNSQAEAAELARAFGEIPSVTVVPNAAEIPADCQQSHDDVTPRGDEIICVGRIEPRKNQLRLIQAVQGTDIRLRLIGIAGRYSGSYEAACRRAAGSNVTFEGPHSQANVFAFMRAAKVHACPSWYETPGLVNLEAALCGCVVVATRGGCTHEYLGDDAIYADPADVVSIRSALQAAIQCQPSDSLVSRIRTLYNWTAAAEKTQQAYEGVLCRWRMPSLVDRTTASVIA